MNSDWTRENGKEKLWWAENAVGRIYFTSPMSPLQPGYMLKSTTSPREMDRLFDKMHAQEREQNEKLIEALYSRGREHYDRLRSSLLSRLASAAASDAEKNIIRESLKLMDEKDAKMQKNNVFGISSMQETEAPLPGPSTRIM
jgi:hypothetical protein